MFIPKIYKGNRMVMTRKSIGVGMDELYLYEIHKLDIKGNVDTNFDTLYCIGSDDYDTIKEFKQSKTGQVQIVRKSNFRNLKQRIFLHNSTEPELVWRKALGRKT